LVVASSEQDYEVELGNDDHELAPIAFSRMPFVHNALRVVFVYVPCVPVSVLSVVA